MKLAQEWSALPNLQSTANLGIEQAHLILSAPEEVREAVATKLEQGEVVSVKELKALKKQYDEQPNGLNISFF